MTLHWLEQIEDDVPSGDDWLSTEERRRLYEFRFEKRRADWRLGRWTAKNAVARFLHLPAIPQTLAEIEVRTPSGAPEIVLQQRVSDVAVSLSHRARTALCAVGPANMVFGCDLETVETRSEAFISDYFTESEYSFLARALPEDRDLYVALLWSAKESVLKALRVGLRVDTRSVSVALDERWAQTHVVEAGNRTNSGEWQSFRARSSDGQQFWGWWRAENRMVRTIVSTARVAAPVQVQDKDQMLCSAC